MNKFVVGQELLIPSQFIDEGKRVEISPLHCSYVITKDRKFIILLGKGSIVTAFDYQPDHGCNTDYFLAIELAERLKNETGSFLGYAAAVRDDIQVYSQVVHGVPTACELPTPILLSSLLGKNTAG